MEKTCHLVDENGQYLTIQGADLCITPHKHKATWFPNKKYAECVAEMYDLWSFSVVEDC